MQVSKSVLNKKPYTKYTKNQFVTKESSIDGVISGSEYRVEYNNNDKGDYQLFYKNKNGTSCVTTLKYHERDLTLIARTGEYIKDLTLKNNKEEILKRFEEIFINKYSSNDLSNILAELKKQNPKDSDIQKLELEKETETNNINFFEQIKKFDDAQLSSFVNSFKNVYEKRKSFTDPFWWNMSKEAKSNIRNREIICGEFPNGQKTTIAKELEKNKSTIIPIMGGPMDGCFLINDHGVRPVLGTGFMAKYGPNMASDNAIIVKINDEPYVVAIKRGDDNGYAFFGGMKDGIEPDAIAGLRETIEESGENPTKEFIVDQIKDYFLDLDKNPKFNFFVDVLSKYIFEEEKTTESWGNFLKNFPNDLPTGLKKDDFLEMINTKKLFGIGTNNDSRRLGCACNATSVYLSTYKNKASFANFIKNLNTTTENKGTYLIPINQAEGMMQFANHGKYAKMCYEKHKKDIPSFTIDKNKIKSGIIELNGNEDLQLELKETIQATGIKKTIQPKTYCLNNIANNGNRNTVSTRRTVINVQGNTVSTRPAVINARGNAFGV